MLLLCSVHCIALLYREIYRDMSLQRIAASLGGHTTQRRISHTLATTSCLVTAQPSRLSHTQHTVLASCPFYPYLCYPLYDIW
jgi:hypothetical protein